MWLCWQVHLPPAAAGVETIGHFAWFHERFRPTLWQDSLAWLEDGSLTRPPRETLAPETGAGS